MDIPHISAALTERAADLQSLRLLGPLQRYRGGDRVK